MNVSQAALDPIVIESQFLVIEAQQMKDGCMEVRGDVKPSSRLNALFHFGVGQQTHHVVVADVGWT